MPAMAGLEEHSNPDPTESRIREAGQLEQFFIVRSRLNFTPWVVVTARYEHAAGTLLDKPRLFAALEQVVRSHAALTVRVLPQTPPVWTRLPSVDLNEVVQFLHQDGDELCSVLETLYASSMEFSEDSPYWKLFVLRDGTAMFAYDHIIGDGQSGVAFHRALLTALNSVQDTPSGEYSGKITALPQDTALIPPVEDGTDVSVPLWMVLREILLTFFPFFNRKLTSAWTGLPAATKVTRDTRIRILRSGADDVASLVRLSRAHHTTLTCMLHTLAVVVLSRLIRARPSGQKYKTIVTTIPMSLRRRTGAPPTAFCNHISPHVGYHPLLDLPSDGGLSGSFPWTAAAELTAALRRDAPLNIGMLKYLFGKYEEFLLGRLGKTRAGGLEVSNLGAFPPPAPNAGGKAQRDGEPAGAWRIREMVFTQADVTAGVALRFNVVGTPDGGLGMSVTWSKESVDQDLAEAFIEGLNDGLRELVASQGKSDS